MKLEKSSAKKNKFIRFIRLVYLKVFHTHDSPHRVSCGLAIGVFSGILPGTGPIAALFLASFLKVNRASALLGSLLTNTWVSFAVPVVSIKIGALLTGLKWRQLYDSWSHIHVDDFLKLSILQVLLPVMLGYLIIAGIAGIATYMVTLIVLKWIKPSIKASRRTIRK